jgi:tetratricopeptide (TPR) repeat protein
MSDLLDNIATQLHHYTHEETIALIRDFLVGLDEREQMRFLKLVAQGPRPLVAEAMGLDDADDLLDEIQSLRDAIANDVYVEYGVGYDPDYGAHRGFGDDSWIEEMDGLFAAATSFFRAGRFEAAVDAYTALFDIFHLSEEGFHFTRPEPDEALRTDVDAMKENLFIAIGRVYPDPAEKAIEISRDFRYSGDNPHALLDAWEGREELMAALEAALIVRARQSVSQRHGLLFHPAKLLHEFYRRYRALPDYETLCRQVGPTQGWPYTDLVAGYREEGAWERVLAWTEEALEKLPDDSRYRPSLREARGEALLHLDRSPEAFDALLPLFRDRPWEASVYLKLRRAARATGRWDELYPQLTREMAADVTAIQGQSSYSVADLTEACLLGYARLLEGEWQKAVEWATVSEVPTGWREENLPRTVATGLLRMALAARGVRADRVLVEALQGAPEIIREYGDRLEPIAEHVPADPMLDGAVRLYELLVEQAIGGRDRYHYARAGAFCKVIRSIRRVQGREADFERYYQGLFATYSRLSALKDELRKAIRD